MVSPQATPRGKSIPDGQAPPWDGSNRPPSDIHHKHPYPESQTSGPPAKENSAHNGSNRREAKGLITLPCRVRAANPRSRSEDWNSSSGLQRRTVRARILTTLLYPKSPPADGFVTQPDPAQTRQQWLSSTQVLRRSCSWWPMNPGTAVACPQRSVLSRSTQQ